MGKRSKPVQVSVPLNIPNVKVLNTAMNAQKALVITIASLEQGTSCHWCGIWIDKFHGYDEWIEIQHLPVFGTPSAVSAQKIQM